MVANLGLVGTEVPVGTEARLGLLFAETISIGLGEELLVEVGELDGLARVVRSAEVAHRHQVHARDVPELDNARHERIEDSHVPLEGMGVGVLEGSS